MNTITLWWINWCKSFRRNWL